MKEKEEKDIDNLLEILDHFSAAGERRMKLDMSDDMDSGEVKRAYHLGCCDIGSPWARGEAFDVLDD